MKFHGLFVGIDRYTSPRILNLTCASRDAQALHALFADTLGVGNATLLTNEKATSVTIRSHFEKQLCAVEPEDVVMLGFSGHGSDSHHLVTYDADPSNFDSTTIHLDELTKLFSNIPARNVILILDCCFAGGAGAKVFHHDIAKKAPVSTEEVLNHISGTGRIILTAANPDQEAIEDRRRGHGLFTFHLLEGLRGAPEVIIGGRISLLKLVDFVTRRVIESAKQMRHIQEPGFRGKTEGDVTFPVFVPGDLYTKAFPDEIQVRVGPDVKSLIPYGFPSELLDIWKGAIPGLNELQQTAINDFGLFRETHLVVSAPTSSGKTMIGELSALRAYLKRERTYFLLPLRALVNDKYTEFVRKYSAYGVQVIRSTGEIEDDNEALMLGKFDIALLTYEKFNSLILTSPHLMRQVGLIVIDEVQMIADPNRGANLEFLLTLLRVQKRLGIEPQLIALSAVIGDSNGLEGWLEGRLLRSDWRPVQLDEGIIGMNGSYRVRTASSEDKTMPQYINPVYRKGSSQDIIIPLLRKLVSDGEKVIVFRETKPIVRATARYLGEALGIKPAETVIASLPDADPSQASELLRECLKGGVAFHNADLDRQERQLLEEAFRDPANDLKVIVATTTLAMGINTPAHSVIIAGLEHPDGPYTVAEYKNMVGRAGRLGFTSKGKSFLVATSPGEEHRLWVNYVIAQPENIESKFADTNPLSLICRVLATAASMRVESMTEEGLVDFIQNSFAAFKTERHSGHHLWNPAILKDSLNRLLNYNLVSEENRRYRLTELGRVAGETGVEVRSVLRLIDALKGVTLPQLSESTLISAVQVTEELDGVLFPVHKRSVQERTRWQGMMRNQGIPSQVIRALQATAKDDSHYTVRCKKTAASLMWIDGVELRSIEASLLRHLPQDNAAGPIRATAERTRDLIPTVRRIAEILNEGKIHLDEIIANLMIRLEIGIPARVVPFAKIAKRSLERGDYLLLDREDLLSLGAITNTSDEVLVKLFRDPKKVEVIRSAGSRLHDKLSLDEENANLPMPRILNDS